MHYLVLDRIALQIVMAISYANALTDILFPISVYKQVESANGLVLILIPIPISAYIFPPLFEHRISIPPTLRSLMNKSLIHLQVILFLIVGACFRMMAKHWLLQSIGK